MYVNTAHHGIGNLPLFQSLKSTYGILLCFYIHDLIPIDWPEFVRGSGASDHVKRMETVASTADLVLVNSNAVKVSFQSWCANAHLPMPQTEICHIGVESRFEAAATLSLQDQLSGAWDFSYFVYVSTIEPRKNHHLLLQIWRDWAKSGVTPPRLIFVGKRGWENESVFNILDRCEAIKPYVAELSGLSDEALIRIIRGAVAVLFPSFDEGWGMPVVEAQVLGTPVICSDIPVFHEASQDCATFIPPLDAALWGEVILDFSKKDSERRKEALDSLQNFTPPRWEEHFAKASHLMLERIASS